jgi:hypothetical protein
MTSSTVAIFITVSLIFAGLYYVKQLELAQYQSNAMKLYLVRAGIAVVPVFLGATLLYFFLSL